MNFFECSSKIVMFMSRVTVMILSSPPEIIKNNIFATLPKNDRLNPL